MPGRVLAAHDGTPVSGARIHAAYDAPAGDESETKHAITRCDVNGDFVIDRAVVHDWVRIEACGYATVDGELARADAPNRPTTILLRRAATLTGSVVDSAGRRLPWAVVSAYRASGTMRFGCDTENHAACDESGHFTLPALAVGDALTLRVWALSESGQEELARLPSAEARADHLQSLLHELTLLTDSLPRVVLAPGESRAIQLRVTAPIAVTGRVVDARGAPVDDVEVQLSTVTRRWSETSSDGSFRFRDVPLGDWVMQAYRRSGCTPVRCTPSIPIRLHRPADGMGIELVIHHGMIRGVVRTDRDATPSPGCRVTAFNVLDPWQRSVVTVEPDGTFTLSGLAPGRYWVRVHGGVSSDPLGPFPTGGAPIVLRAASRRAIRGDIATAFSDEDEVIARHQSTGREVQGHLDPEEDAEHDLEVDDLRPGTYDVIAYLRGDRIALAPSVVVGTDRDTVIDRPLRPEPACVLRVRIDGPKADYRIAIHAQRWNVRLPEVWISAADVALGAYIDVIVPAGSLDVRVLVPNAGGPLASRHVHAVPGRESTLTIRLR